MDLANTRVLLTSGPTRANLDAVRYVANRSSGRLGRTIAVELLQRGARVTMVAGPDSAVPDTTCGLDLAALQLVRIETVDDLVEALRTCLHAKQPPQVIIHAMAVLDYVPEAPDTRKTPSGRDMWEVRLVRSPKVIRLIRDWAPEACLVQFKLEVGLDDNALRQAATGSMRSNRADLCVANDLSRIRDEVHPALIVGPDGAVLARPGTKTRIATALCDVLAGLPG